MSFEVRAALLHPDGPPGYNEIQLDGEGDPRAASHLLLQAVDQVQEHAGVPSTLNELIASRTTIGHVSNAFNLLGIPMTPSELEPIGDWRFERDSDMSGLTRRSTVLVNEVIASRGTFEALSSTLDELGVGPAPNDGMLGVVQRLGMLGNEVRALRAGVGAPEVARVEHERVVDQLTRERDSAAAVMRAYAEVINEVRRSLDVHPGVPDASLARRVGELVEQAKGAQGAIASYQDMVTTLGAQRDRLAQVREGMADTIREVREALKVPPETRDVDLGKVAALEHETLEMIHNDLFERVHVTLPPDASLAQSAGVHWSAFLTNADAELDAAHRWLSLSPERLAVEIHNGRSFAGLSVMESWENFTPALKEQSVKAAGYTLQRLGAAEPVSTATPEHLAQVLFAVSREASKTRGSEPMPIIEKSGWDEAHPNRRKWWLEVAGQALEQLRIVPSVSLLPVTAAELGRAMYESGPHATPWEQVAKDYTENAQRVLDSLPSFAADKTAQPRVTPQQLARAMHVARSALTQSGTPGVRPPLFMPTPWAEQGSRAQDWFERVAEIALSELPQIARTDAEQDRQFAAHMDAQFAELRGELRHALDALREIAGTLGMSFGNSDDAAALGMLTSTAVKQHMAESRALARTNRRVVEENRQLVEAGSDANSDMHVYRNMLLWVAGQLGIVPDTVDDFQSKAFQTAFADVIEWRAGGVEKLSEALISLRGLPEFSLKGRFIAHDAAEAIVFLRDQLTAAQARPVFQACVPRPEDWMVKLTPVDPSETAMRLAAVRHGVQLNINGAVYKVEFHYTGTDPVRPAGAPVVSWSDLAGQARKTGVAVPGEAFTFGVDGEPQKVRMFKVDDEASVVRSDADVIASAITDLSGGKIMAFDPKSAMFPGSPSVLTQLREQGEALRADEEFRKGLAQAVGAHSVNPVVLLSVADELARFQRAHRVCQGAEALERELIDQLAEALGHPVPPPMGGEWGWGELIHLVSQTADWRKKAAARSGDLRRAMQLPEHVSWDALVSHAAQASGAVGYLQRMLGLEAQAYPAQLFAAVRDLVDGNAALKRARGDMTQDLSRALGLNSDESWGDMIEAVTGRTSREATVKLEHNALAEIRRMLGLHERLFPAGVADAVSSAVTVGAEADGCRRAMVELRDVLDMNASAESVTVVRAVRELRRGVVIPGVDEVGRIKDAVETLLEAAGIDLVEDFTRPDVTVQKAGDAAAILRSWPDVLRGLSAFDIAEPGGPDDVEAMLEDYAKTYHFAGRYQAVLHNIEIMLSEWTGNPKQFDDSTLKQRLADVVADLSSDQVSMWASFAEQVAAKLESAATLRADADDPAFVQGTQFPEVWHKGTLGHAAAVVRAHSAALVSGQEKHPLVTALESQTCWAPGAESNANQVGRLEVWPEQGGAFLRTVVDGETSRRLGLEPGELAPVGAALLALSFHHVRETGRKRELGERRALLKQMITEEAAAEKAKAPTLGEAFELERKAREAAEIAAGAEEVKAVGPIRVAPTVPQEWCYGPNAIDPDPGKRWHIGCGGEVLTFDGVDVCGGCEHEWEPTEAGQDGPQ